MSEDVLEPPRKPTPDMAKLPEHVKARAHRYVADMLPANASHAQRMLCFQSIVTIIKQLS